MYTVIVSPRGQIVIPLEVRKKLNIGVGDVLHLHVEEGGRLVMKAGKRGKIKSGIVDRTAGILSGMEIEVTRGRGS
ncbi:MAG: AbrB/MazE/SpoVT family DNA-binding domain-containing protein [Desulfocucumaceae bacterium]